jgi:hypothetical protein
MYTFGIIAGVVVVLGIIGMIASTYTEKFERNFIFTGTAAALVVGEAIVLTSIFFADDVMGNAELLDVLTAVATFAPNLDVYSGFFYFGALIILFAWYANISASSLVWGMIQNVLQTIIVTVFSVIIVVGAIFLSDSLNKSKSKK